MPVFWTKPIYTLCTDVWFLNTTISEHVFCKKKSIDILACDVM